MKYILKREDIENESEIYMKALSEAIKQTFEEVVYNSSIEINSYIKLTKVYDDCYAFTLDLPIEEKFLLSFSNEDHLDGAYFDVEALLWNEIVLNDEDIQEYNHYTVEQENLFDLCYEIEQEILKNELTIDKNFNPIDLISLIDIDLFINEYFNFKDKVDIQCLKSFIEQGIIDLDKWITNNIKSYFNSDDYYDLIDNIEFAEQDYIWSEINKHDFFEVYI